MGVGFFGPASVAAAGLSLFQERLKESSVVVCTWALRGLLHPVFGLLVLTIMVLRAFGFQM